MIPMCKTVLCMLAFAAAFVAGVILKQFFYKQSRDFLNNIRNLWKGKRF